MQTETPTPGIDLKPCPRVNKAHLSQWVGSTVRVVGKMKGAENTGRPIVQLETADGIVDVVTRSFMTFPSTFVEVLGVVDQKLNIEEQKLTCLGENFEMSSYTMLLQYMHLHKEPFL
ncbi:hypothetical protein QOT17_011455 [Balamuthia mandrillaris]